MSSNALYKERTHSEREPEIIEIDLEGSLIPQKLFGTFLAVMAVMVPVICGDCTASVVLLPSALGLIFAKEKVM